MCNILLCKLPHFRYPMMDSYAASLSWLLCVTGWHQIPGLVKDLLELLTLLLLSATVLS